VKNKIQNKHDSEKVTDIICDAGGEIVGRTRLQKLAYILELAGVGEGFVFEYRHFGPYCESLAIATKEAGALGKLTEEEHLASWGGFFSIFRTDKKRIAPHPSRIQLASIAKSADPVELELAATAAYLYKHGETNPWGETKNRKADKARDGRLERAQTLYSKLQDVQTPTKLPQF
jgi:uncharacterized protein YwgA